MVKGGFHIGKAIKAGQCVAGVLAQAIEDDAQGIFADLIGAADNTDAALRRRKGFVTGQKAEAAGILIQQHSGQVAVAGSHLAGLRYGARNGKGL